LTQAVELGNRKTQMVKRGGGERFVKIRPVGSNVFMPVAAAADKMVTQKRV